MVTNAALNIQTRVRIGHHGIRKVNSKVTYPYALNMQPIPIIQEFDFLIPTILNFKVEFVSKKGTYANEKIK